MDGIVLHILNRYKGESRARWPSDFRDLPRAPQPSSHDESGRGDSLDTDPIVSIAHPWRIVAAAKGCALASVSLIDMDVEEGMSYRGLLEGRKDIVAFPIMERVTESSRDDWSHELHFQVRK